MGIGLGVLLYLIRIRVKKYKRVRDYTNLVNVIAKYYKHDVSEKGFIIDFTLVRKDKRLLISYYNDNIHCGIGSTLIDTNEEILNAISNVKIKQASFAIRIQEILNRG